MKEIIIECPKCKWQPDGNKSWECVCGLVWNTFDTQGICPNCNKSWQYTQCPGFHGGCDVWSPHIDWYNIPLNIEQLLEEEATLELKITNGQIKKGDLLGVSNKSVSQEMKQIVEEWFKENKRKRKKLSVT